MLKKIKEEQLKRVQNILSKKKEAQMTLGDAMLKIRELENYKEQVIKTASGLETELKDFQKLIQEIYGNISIDIEDGSYTEIPTQADSQPTAKKVIEDNSDDLL